MNLEAEKMSFGYNSNAGTRYTTDFPTKSVLFGMLCCAMGKKGVLTETFGKLRKIKMESFAMSESQVETDFQTIGTGWEDSKMGFIDKNTGKFINISEEMVEHRIDGSKSSTCTSLIDKDYLVNQRFIVLLEIEDDAFAEKIAESLKRPVWQMYVGRKKCVPCGRVFYGIFDSKENAMNVIDGMNPLYKFTEEEPDEYIDEMNVRDVPTTEFNKYDTYTHRRVYKCEYKAC